MNDPKIFKALLWATVIVALGTTVLSIFVSRSALEARQNQLEAAKAQVADLERQLTEAKNTVQMSFYPCSPTNCGNYPQNVATLHVNKAIVSITPDGKVHITLKAVQQTSDQKIAANKKFEVLQGSFVAGWNGKLIGTIVTDEKGNFDGVVTTAAGIPFVCDPAQAVMEQFVLNDPGVRSEFYTMPQSWDHAPLPVPLGNVKGSVLSVPAALPDTDVLGR